MNAVKAFGALILCGAALTGCSRPFVQPTEGPIATVEFSRAFDGKGNVWIYSDSENCAERFEAATLESAATAEVKVPASRELALTFGSEWRTTDGPTRTYVYNCALTSSFVPEPGKAYRVELQQRGTGCNLSVRRKDAAPGAEGVRMRLLELKKDGGEGAGYCVSHRQDPDLGAYFRRAEARAESNALLEKADSQTPGSAEGLATITEAAMLGDPIALLRLCSVYTDEQGPPSLWPTGYAWCSATLGAVPRFHAQVRGEASYLRSGVRERISKDEVATAKLKAEEILREIQAR